VRRRIVTFLVLLAAMVGGTSGAQALGARHTHAAGYWGCVGTSHVDLGVCFENPLPQHLPTVPSVPAL
jgi:hypothetical protein